MDETFNSFSDQDLLKHEDHITQKLEVIEQKIARLKAQKVQLLQWQEAIHNVQARRRTNQQTERNWEDETFPWSAEVRRTLREVFSITEFRPQQLNTINALLDGKDVLLLAPTGGGKSLCFQLPALVSRGVTVVISPLVSLMEDQVWSLAKRNIEARMICASTGKERINQIQKDLSNKQGLTMKLLYVTPERMAKSKRFMMALQKCYENGHLDRFAIDEVHCCSQWGHDFRPDYKFLGVLKELFPKTPLLGVTATATTKVINDVQKLLKMSMATVFVATFNRPNLYYHVLAKPNESQDQYDVLSNLLLLRYRQKSGIIYTFSVKDAVDISTELKKRGLKVAPYHANLAPIDRTKIHQMWHKNELQAVVATIAFGMGIDKPDVRFVIHHTMSKSLENYFQESGRAGRDGQRAECILMYQFSDIFRISTMTFSEHTGLENAYAMIEYCINVSDCRRKIISQHFSEVWGSEDCSGMCDRCLNSELCALRPNMDVIELLGQLNRIISMASRKDIKLTGLKLVAAWMHKGPKDLRLSEPPPPLDRAVAEQIVAFLIVNNYLKESFTYTPYATYSYIILGQLVESNSLMVRVGKLFELSHVEDRTVNAASTNQKSVSKKRSLPDSSKKTTNNAKSKTSEKSPKAKRPKNAPSGGREDIATTSNNGVHVDDGEDVMILSQNQEIIEIDAD